MQIYGCQCCLKPIILLVIIHVQFDCERVDVRVNVCAVENQFFVHVVSERFVWSYGA